MPTPEELPPPAPVAPTAAHAPAETPETFLRSIWTSVRPVFVHVVEGIALLSAATVMHFAFHGAEWLVTQKAGGTAAPNVATVLFRQLETGDNWLILLLSYLFGFLALVDVLKICFSRALESFRLFKKTSSTQPALNP